MLWSKIVAVAAFVPAVLSTPLFILKSSDVDIDVHTLAARDSAPAGKGTYTVASGDTGYAIAAAYSITFNTLNASNPTVNWGALAVGQTLNMPSSRLPYSYKIASGDTESSIASAYNVYNVDISNANPNVNFNNIPVGQTIKVPGYGRTTSWTVVSGDTGSNIAQAFQVSFDQLSSANPGVNWNNLQIGQKLNVPIAVSPATGTVPTSTTAAPSSTTFTTTTTSSASLTTTTTASCKALGVSCIANQQCCSGSCVKGGSGAICVANNSTTTTTTTTTGVSATTTSTSTTKVTTSTSTTKLTTTTSTTMVTTTTTKVTSTITTTKTSTTTSTTPKPTTTTTTTTTSKGPVSASVTGPLAVKTVTDSDGNANNPDQYTFYQGDGSTGAGWPAASQWASFNLMWNRVSPYLGQACQSIYGVANNSPTENQNIHDAIQDIAAKSGVDHRLILATIVQESSACVRAPITKGGETNPGLMQDYNGNATCNTGTAQQAGVVSNPCPQATIYQMIVDGTMGTNTKTAQPAGGLVQDIQSQSTYAMAQAYYRSSRLYNAGSIPSNGDLGAAGATRCYCSDIANRLMGWVTASSSCHF